jgi:hypothetical protein
VVRDRPDERCGLVQALLPFAVGIGVRGDAAADAEDRLAELVELDRPDRDIQLAARFG